MFEVASTALEEGLDRFAQFFIAPLLKQESAEKEIHAVDSEHQKNKQDD
jgi:insulysin